MGFEGGSASTLREAVILEHAGNGLGEGGETLFTDGVPARGLLRRAPERGRETGGHEGEQ